MVRAGGLAVGLGIEIRGGSGFTRRPVGACRPVGALAGPATPQAPDETAKRVVPTLDLGRLEWPARLSRAKVLSFWNEGSKPE